MDHGKRFSATRAEGEGTQALDRALGLLRVIATRSANGTRLSELVQISALSKPTAHRLVRALERSGLIEQDQATRLYHLGPEAFVVGTLSAERFGIQRAAIPSLAALAGQSQDSAFLSVRRDRHAVCLHREEGAYPIRTHVLGVGDRHPLGIGAGSLAMLAALDDAELESVLAGNADELAAGYPTYSVGFLRDAVAQTREQGFAFNPGQLLAGSWGLGAAVIDEAGICHGAISIAAIESRLGETRRKQLVPLLLQEAKWLAHRMSRPGGKAQQARETTTKAKKKVV